MSDLIFHYFVISEYVNNEPWESQCKVENEVWFCKNIRELKIRRPTRDMLQIKKVAENL